MSDVLRQMILARLRYKKDDGQQPVQAPKPATPPPVLKSGEPDGPETTPAIAPGSHVSFASPTQTLGSATDRKSIYAGSNKAHEAGYQAYDSDDDGKDPTIHLDPSKGKPEGYKGPPKEAMPGVPIMAGMLHAAQNDGSIYADTMNELHDHFHAALHRARREFKTVDAVAKSKGEDWHKKYQYLGTGPVAAHMYNLRETIDNDSNPPEVRQQAAREFQFYSDNYSQLSGLGEDLHGKVTKEKAIPGFVGDTGMSADNPSSLYNKPQKESETTHAKDVLSKAGMGLNGDIHSLLYDMRNELRESHAGMRNADHAAVDAHRRKLEAYYQLEATISNMEIGSHTMAQANNPTMNAFASWYRDGGMKALGTQIDLINNSPVYKRVKGMFGDVVKGEDGLHRVRWDTPEQAANAMMLLYAVAPTSANEVPDSNWKFAMGVVEDGLHQWTKKHANNPEALARGPSVMDLFAHAQEDRGHLEHYSKFGEQSPAKFVKGAWLTMPPEEQEKHYDFARSVLVPNAHAHTVNSPEDLTKFIQYGVQDEEEGGDQEESEAEVPTWRKDNNGEYKLLPIKKGLPTAASERSALGKLRAALNKELNEGNKTAGDAIGYLDGGKHYSDLHNEHMEALSKMEAGANGKETKRYYDESGKKLTKEAADKLAMQKVLASGEISGLDPSMLKGIETKADLNKLVNTVISNRKSDRQSAFENAVSTARSDAQKRISESTVGDFLRTIIGKRYSEEKYPGLADKTSAFLDYARKVQGDSGIGDELDTSFGSSLVYTRDANGEYKLLNKSLQARPESIKRAIRLSKLFARAGHASDLVRGKDMPHEDKVDLIAKAIYGEDSGAVFHDVINSDAAKAMFPGMTPDEQARAHARNLAEMLAKHEGDSQSAMLGAFMAGAHDNHMLNKFVPMSRNSFFSGGFGDDWKYTDESTAVGNGLTIPDQKKQGGFDVAGQKYGPYGRSVAGGPTAAFLHMLNGAITPPDDRYVADRVMSEIHGQALGRRFSGVPENEMQRAAWNHGVGILADVLGRRMGGKRPTVDQIQAIVWASQQAQVSALGGGNPTANLYTGAEDVFRAHKLHAQRVIAKHEGSQDPDVQAYVNDAKNFLNNAVPLRHKTMAGNVFYGNFSSIPEVRNASGGYDLVGHDDYEQRRKTLANMQAEGQNIVGGIGNAVRQAVAAKLSRVKHADGARSGGAGRVGEGGSQVARAIRLSIGRLNFARNHAREEAVPPVPALSRQKQGASQRRGSAPARNAGKARSAHDVPARDRLKYSGQFMRSMLLGTSATAKKFRTQLDEIASQIGVRLSTFSGVGDAQSTASPATAHIADNTVDPDLARYLGAWSGLLGGRTSVMVFHPHPQGEDSFHTMTLPVTDMQKLRASLDEKGIRHRTVIPGKQNTHVMVYDPRRMMRNALAEIAEEHDGHILESTGRAEFLGRPANRPGTDPAADSRQHYRRIIADFEERRGVPNQTGTSPDGNSGGASVSGSPVVGRSPSGGAIVRGLTYKGGSFTPAEEQKAPPAPKPGSPERFKRRLKYSHFEPKGQHAHIVREIANDTALHQMEKAPQDLNDSIVKSFRGDGSDSPALAARLSKNMKNESARADRLVSMLSKHLNPTAAAAQPGHDQTGDMAQRIGSLFSGMPAMDPNSALEEQQGKVAGMVTPASIAQNVAKHAEATVPGIREAVLEHANLHSGGIPRVLPHGPAGRSWANLDAIWGHGNEQKERARVVDDNGHPAHYLPTMMREFFSRPVRMAREHPETTDWLLGMMSGAGRKFDAAG